MKNLSVWGLALLIGVASCGDKKSDQKVTGASMTGGGEARPEQKPDAPKPGPKAKTRPTKPGKPSKEQLKAYNDALKRGRAASKKKDWAGAIKAFEECLTLAPDDAMALSELGWALYSSGDLVKGEEVTRHAVATANEPRFKGSDLYNLGMILLAKKDNPGAIAAFKDSLRARPNKTVRAALEKLDPEAAKEFELFAPTWLAASGSPEKECAALAQDAAKAEPAGSEDAEVEADWDIEICTCTDPVENGTLAKPDGPWKAVRLVANACHFKGTMMGENVWDLYVQTKEGSWFRREAVASVPDTGRAMGELKVEELVLRPGAGGAQALLVRLSEMTSYSGGGFEEESEVESLIVAGVGASGKPSATPSIELRHHVENVDWSEVESENDEGKTSLSLDLELGWTFTPAGELTLDPKATKGVDGKALNEVVGTHPIVFP
jgi:hypothetical protein